MTETRCVHCGHSLLETDGNIINAEKLFKVLMVPVIRFVPDSHCQRCGSTLPQEHGQAA